MNEFLCAGELIPLLAGVAVMEDSLSELGRRSQWILGVWVVAGLACLLLDHHVQPWIVQLGHIPTIRIVASQWHQLGSTLGFVAFFGALIVAARAAIKPAAFALVLTGVVAQIIKHCVGRERPNWSHDATVFYGPLGVLNSGPRVPIDSFPSGHTAAAFAMAGILAWRWPRATWLWYFLATGVAVSRVLVDVHFPSDVILGALLGTLVCQMVLMRMTREPRAKLSLVRNP
jgi:membrane-associated phospholipid phosphatase